jgi:hypothetical protein
MRVYIIPAQIPINTFMNWNLAQEIRGEHPSQLLLQVQRDDRRFQWQMDGSVKRDPFLPGIEFGMVAVKIDHVEPLLQLVFIISAPAYSLGHFVCNYRTDGTEVVTSILPSCLREAG